MSLGLYVFANSMGLCAYCKSALVDGHAISVGFQGTKYQFHDRCWTIFEVSLKIRGNGLRQRNKESGK